MNTRRSIDEVVIRERAGGFWEEPKMPKVYARRNVPEELDEEMTCGDIIDALERLRFADRPSLPLRIDAGVRDYMVRLLRERR
jgi:hypothetical protein